MPLNRLAVLRHAKATHEPGYRDFDRPLTRRGQRDAAAVGGFLRARGIAPDLVLCSSSSRTSETWQYLATGADATGAGGAVATADATVRYERRIYDAGMADLLEIIRETPASVRTLMIIGHNPAAYDLVVALTGNGDIEFPTCALAVIDLTGSWAAAPAEGGRLERLWTPKGNTR